MVLHIFSTVVSQTIPSAYYLPGILAFVVVAFLRAYAQGRRTNRDRDLHARTVILTGAFTPLGLTLLEFLAKRGAHIIALVPTPSLTSHHGEILTLLRETTGNKAIYAEPCPLDSPTQIKDFCKRFVTAENENDRRVDALIMTHEYSHIGTWSFGFVDTAILRNKESVHRDETAMATFLLTTLLLPALLVAPVERDIRIINIVNPFYAAAAPTFIPTLSSSTYGSHKGTTQGSPSNVGTTVWRSQEQISKWCLEGQRALRSAVFTRHLQRILDALPEYDSVATSSSTNAVDPKRPKLKPQPSNILAVTVSPGISRTDTVAPYLFPPVSDRLPSLTRQWVATLLYFFLQPILHTFTKTPTSSLQGVLHVLCVPKPVTRQRTPLAEDPAQLPPQAKRSTEHNNNIANSVDIQAEEVLVPGALYADCAVVKLNMRAVPEYASEKMEERGEETNTTGQFELGLGDEPLGRAVWEALEEGVKIWETQEAKREAEKDQASTVR